MRKLSLTCLSLLLCAGISHATGTPCNGFEIKVKNDTPDDLIASKIHISGGKFQPDGIQTIPAHSEQALIVNNSADKGKMQATLELHSISLPSKKVLINFDLKNKHLICHHDNNHVASDYKVNSYRLPGKVTYTIG